MSYLLTWRKSKPKIKTSHFVWANRLQATLMAWVFHFSQFLQVTFINSATVFESSFRFNFQMKEKKVVDIIHQRKKSLKLLCAKDTKKKNYQSETFTQDTVKKFT